SDREHLTWLLYPRRHTAAVCAPVRPQEGEQGGLRLRMGGTEDGMDGPMGRGVRDGDPARAQQFPLDRRGEPALRPGPVVATERYEEVRPVSLRRPGLRQRPLPGRAGG